MAQSHPLLVRTSSAQRIPAARQVLKAGALAVIRSTVSSPARPALPAGGLGEAALPAQSRPPQGAPRAGERLLGAPRGGGGRGHLGTGAPPGPSGHSQTLAASPRSPADPSRGKSLRRTVAPRSPPPRPSPTRGPPRGCGSYLWTGLTRGCGSARSTRASSRPGSASPPPPRWAGPGEPRTAHRGGARGAQRQRAHGPPAPGTRAPLAG